MAVDFSFCSVFYVFRTGFGVIPEMVSPDIPWLRNFGLSVTDFPMSFFSFCFSSELSREVQRCKRSFRVRPIKEYPSSDFVFMANFFVSA